MKKILLFLLVFFCSFSISKAQTLVHYWNFNNSTSEATLLAPSSSLVTGATITHNIVTNSEIPITGNTTGQGFEITNPNSRNADVAGAHLRFNNPVGGNLVFSLPTTGYKDVIIKYATRRSGSGAYNQIVDYSIDGTTFTNFTTILPVDGNPTLQTLDFSAVRGVRDNPNFKIRFSFTAGGGGAAGNNRFDNFTLEGNVISYTNALVHYWNFNDPSSQNALLTPSVSLIAGSSITNVAGGTSVIDFANGTGQDFNINNLNARNGDASGTHLRFNNPIGGALTFALPTNNSKDVIIKYVTRRSTQGAGTQVVEYSLDGSNYTLLRNVSVTETPTLETLDFSAILLANDNPNFKVRFSFTATGGGTGGNNRIDNFTVDAQADLTDNIGPTLSFSPANNSNNIATSIQPTLTFNEAIRLIDNTAINNTNVDALVELRLTNGSGTLVPFDATITGQVITIVPSSALANNQTYYVALKANVVEDLNNNAITAVQSSLFTTIALQTTFVAGDLVPVAYRMNATGTEDEIAFLTTKDILAGTIINLTDAKYTDNATPQCPGGITWTAPSGGVAAGTVISIQTSALVANIGTVSGASFGLSSSGDQVIVYTGSNTSPNFITALSANAWLTTPFTTCSGSESKLPAGLTDGTSSINLSTAPANVAGLTVNAYYNGTQTGTFAALKAAILNPANWVGAASGTAPQTWPTFSFPGPPTVTSARVVNQTTIELVFNRLLNTTSVSNFTGIAGLSSITQTNGATASTLLLNYTTPFVLGSNNTLTVNGVQDTDNRPMFNAYTFSFSYNTTIAFTESSYFVSVNENVGSVNISLTLTNPSPGSVDVVLKSAPFSTTNATDITYSTQTINFTGASTASQIINIPINDDAVSEMDEYFILSLENLNGSALSGKQYFTVFIKDNDRLAPVPTQEISLNYISSFKPNINTGSTTEIVVHDAATQRLFMTSAVQDRLDIADFSNPAAITIISSIDMAPYGGITSVAVKNGVVAVASPNANEQLDGSVVFFNTNGVFQKQVTVGALPDMITFSPDGNKIITANEGQPNVAYTVDPEGSVSIIDISGGLASVDQTKVTTLNFTAYNAQEATLISSGIRKTKSTSTLSQDFEPEYVTISADSKKAWVALQENNAIAEINLETNTYTNLWPLGKKDFNINGSGFDASDNSGVVHISNYPVKSYFMPDGMANYTANGKTYLVTANEGDEKEYGSFVERTTVAAVNLDPVIFPNAAVLKENHHLGRLRITNLNGDLDNDNDYDELIMVGSRSFSIFDTDTKAIVYDSKDDFELFTSKSPLTAAIFNADNESNGFKNRSRAKGPEPEGVTVETINGMVYAFVGLERVGGVMVYNITDPANVKLVDYKNNRSTTSFTGDLGPEGIIYIPAASSPNGKAYITIANELSGNISVFEVIGASTLPIELISFDAKLQSTGNVLLNWSTASETNNDYFTLERSTDGKTFTTLTKVKTKGNGTARQEYSFIDNNPLSGGNYYRLTQTDINGDQGKAEIRFVNVSLTASTWSVYPNPMTGSVININTNISDMNSANVKLYSLSGKLIYDGKSDSSNGQIQISLKDKPSSGLYLISIEGLGTKQILLN